MRTPVRESETRTAPRDRQRGGCPERVFDLPPFKVCKGYLGWPHAQEVETERRTRCKRRRAVVSGHINAIHARIHVATAVPKHPLFRMTYSWADFRDL